MASYHRLSTTLNAWLQLSRKQVEAAIEQTAPLVEEDYYERRRCEQLNDFNNRDLIQIYKEARDTMAFNNIEPIILPPVGYGEREPYQEVKAHLISPYSNRISAASRSVCDNWISQRGDKPIVGDTCIDIPSFRNCDCSINTSHAATPDSTSAISSKGVSKATFEDIWKKLEGRQKQIKAEYIQWLIWSTYGGRHRPQDRCYNFLRIVINEINYIMWSESKFTSNTPINIYRLTQGGMEYLNTYYFCTDLYRDLQYAARYHIFGSTLSLDQYVELLKKIEQINWEQV